MLLKVRMNIMPPKATASLHPDWLWSPPSQSLIQNLLGVLPHE